jgi:hypothetical protein
MYSLMLWKGEVGGLILYMSILLWLHGGGFETF